MDLILNIVLLVIKNAYFQVVCIFTEHDYQSEFLACYDVSMVIEIMRRFPDIVDIQIFGCKLVTLATEGVLSISDILYIV